MESASFGQSAQRTLTLAQLMPIPTIFDPPLILTKRAIRDG
jgi:hypothetical protein